MTRIPDVRTSLRLTAEQHSMIENSCRMDGGRIPMSAWIESAINEKLARDRGQGYESNNPSKFHFYEFFAGGGMARSGLGSEWNCLFANDFDPMKARTYRANWDGGRELLVEDVNKISIDQLPGTADLAWASFPCQDLSLAGKYMGIGKSGDSTQTRSGTFWPFWRLMRDLQKVQRAPKMIVLENVYGVLTSNAGRDFAAIGSVFEELGYSFGALVIDARIFVPQSRPRVFIVGVRGDLGLPINLVSSVPSRNWHPEGLLAAHAGLSSEIKKRWVWWNLAIPRTRSQSFLEQIEEDPEGVEWNSQAQTSKLVSMMSELNKQKLKLAKASGRKMVGGVYKRTRMDSQGNKVQRAEVRFDDVAGCLRTPAGGSSRQSILLVDGNSVRSRLLSPREVARLMGLPESYVLPRNYNDAYHVAGDGVVVPVVRHLAASIVEPILRSKERSIREPSQSTDCLDLRRTDFSFA